MPKKATPIIQGILEPVIMPKAAGFITIEKTFVKKRPRTVVQLTTGGRQAIDEHWRRLDEARQLVAEWRTKLEPVPER